MTFKFFGVDLVGELYLPNDFDPNKKYKTLVGASPFPQVRGQIPATNGPEMAARGFIYLGFDYLGMGDSPALPGEYKKSRYMFRLIENIWDAVSYLGTLPIVEEIYGLGVCQGGSIFRVFSAQTSAPTSCVYPHFNHFGNQRQRDDSGVIRTWDFTVFLLIIAPKFMEMASKHAVFRTIPSRPCGIFSFDRNLTAYIASFEALAIKPKKPPELKNVNRTTPRDAHPPPKAGALGPDAGNLFGLVHYVELFVVRSYFAFGSPTFSQIEFGVSSI